MEFRVDVMGYTASRPHTCRMEIAAPTLQGGSSPMKTAVDALALADLATPAPGIWERVRVRFYRDNNVEATRVLSREQVVSRVYRARAQHYGSDPHGVAEVPPLSLALTDSVNFFQFHFVTANRSNSAKPCRLIGCAHPTLLALLRYRSTRLFVDGTFRCVSASFEQCVTVMVHNKASQIFVQVFHILSTSKPSDAYWDILNFVAQATDQRLALVQVVTAFEPAHIGEVLLQFPEADVVGCLFHFNQAVARAMRRPHVPSSESRLAMARGCLDMLTVIPVNKISQHGIRWVDGGIRRRCEADYISFSSEK
ncbi:hypothetical protein PybrP1_001685 [[Pythium] brassicae (nom. inval.)]|nr:hypothetical protein PybrP1_001685 [[Pythium] brassicae (nom. inval.)]